jgi:hypothetical protein
MCHPKIEVKAFGQVSHGYLRVQAPLQKVNILWGAKHHFESPNYQRHDIQAVINHWGETSRYPALVENSKYW